jgi:CBS domain-containing protein
VPVVDHHGAIIGIISEADLIRSVEIGTEKRSKWREFVTGKCGRRQEFLKSQGVRASDVMTKPVVTATPQMPLGELVSLFDKYRIKRLPVVDGEKIIGIVSRANLLQALALALGHEGVGEAA